MNSEPNHTNPLDLQSDLLELTRTLCDIPSESGHEAPLADAIEAALLGYEHLRVERHGNTVIARTELGLSQRVVIAGHIDTVPINKNLPSQIIEEQGEPYLFARGSVDMKGGVAVQLSLAAELIAPRVDLSWIFYDNEEVAASLNGLGLLAAARPELLLGDFAVLCEPTSAQIEGGCQGTLRFRISTSGVRAHSARSWMGENAIHRLQGALEILNNYQAAEPIVDGLKYHEGLNAVAIEGGIAGNVIPDYAAVVINYRFAPDKTVAKAVESMQELFAGYAFELLDSSAGARPGLDHELAQAFVSALGTPVAAKYGWTDVARFWELGIPAVNYGPGDPSRAHADDEALKISELYQCKKGLLHWLSYN
ncbi:MAG: succinyl-diaminopimelate desuccinylase [Microbacteriaceae bacterium]